MFFLMMLYNLLKVNAGFASQLVAYCGCGVHGSKSTKCERMLCKLHFTSNCHMHNQEKKLAEVCKTCGMLLNSFSTLTNRMLLSLYQKE